MNTTQLNTSDPTRPEEAPMSNSELHDPIIPGSVWSAPGGYEYTSVSGTPDRTGRFVWTCDGDLVLSRIEPGWVLVEAPAPAPSVLPDVADLTATLAAARLGAPAREALRHLSALAHAGAEMMVVQVKFPERQSTPNECSRVGACILRARGWRAYRDNQ